MTIWKNYYLAHSVEDALNALARKAGEARPIAGGTDFLLDLQQGRHPPVDTLVDLTHIPEMCLLEERGDRLFIGAALPIKQVIGSRLVKQHAAALVDAASLIGGPQVRNTATLGGNVGHALPAADGTIALLALDTKAQVASLKGTYEAALSDLFRGPGKTALDLNREFLVGFYIPLKKPGQGSAFRRIMRPQGVAIAILNTAVRVDRAGDRIQDIRISIGPAGPTPFRAIQTEEALRGKPFDPQLLQEAEKCLLAEARFRTSPHRATEEYRTHMAGVLLRDTFQTAWNRAASNETGEEDD